MKRFLAAASAAVLIAAAVLFAYSKAFAASPAPPSGPGAPRGGVSQAAPGCAGQAVRADNVSILGDNATAPLFADRYFGNALQTTHGAITPIGTAKWVECFTYKGNYPVTFGTVDLWNEGTQLWAGDSPQDHHINTATAGIAGFSEPYLFVCHGRGQFTLENLSMIGDGMSVTWSADVAGTKFAEVNAQGTPDLFSDTTGLCV